MSEKKHIVMRLRRRMRRGLKDLCEYCQLKDKVMVEVGCYAGESTVIFANYVKKIYAIDPWQIGMKLARRIKMDEDVEKRFDDRIKGYDNIIKLKGYDFKFVDSFGDNSLDFVYIDALHDQQSVEKNIKLWLPKVKEGSYIGGHDYGKSFPGVKKAVNIFFGSPNHIFCDSSWIAQ